MITTPASPDPLDEDLDPVTGLVTGKFNRNPPGIGFWALVREDLATHDGDPLSQGFWALFWHRFGNWRMSVRPQLLRAPLTLVYRVMFKVTEWLCGISLPYTSLVGRRVRLEHFGGMILAPRSIGSDVVLRQNTTFGIARTDDLAGRPIIGDHVDVGAGVVIIGGITVGRGAVIGANSVVTRPVPPYAVAVGAPARVLRMRDPAEIGDPPLPGGLSAPVTGPAIAAVPGHPMAPANVPSPVVGDPAAGPGDTPRPIPGKVAIG